MDLDEKLPIVDGAAFDSYVDQHEDECLPGTRTDILRQIIEWAFSPQGRCIFWLNGMAGTGKSTISRTVAKSFSKAKSLGASFFFKRGEGDRGNAKKLFPTVARQLAISIPQLRPCIQQAVHDDPSIAAKAMKEQFDKLLLRPLLSLTPYDLPIRTVVMVIDALDECEGDNDTRLLLQLLPQLQKSMTMRLRVFLTSRPELPIRMGFKKLANHDHEDVILHEVPKEVVLQDISLFLNHRLSEIRTEREPHLPIDWPGETNLQKLVALSVPLFIFAATICRIFEDPDWNPEDSLAEILTQRDNVSKLVGMYIPVLSRLLNRQNEKQKKQLVQEFQQVVGAIVILERPLSVVSLSRLLGLPESLIHLRLNPLHSVLNVPNDETSPVRLFHLSFRDFLLDPDTREKTPFGVDKKEMHHTLTIQCLLVCQNLRKNMCGLRSDGTQRAGIDRQTIDQSFPPELQYACRYWAHHLVQCTDLTDVMQVVLLFLQRYFLHWMEAMGLLGLVSEMVAILNLLQTVTPGDHYPAVSDFLHDAKRFILKNRQIADEAPLQVYCAGLIFAPRTAIIRGEFKTELPTWICRLPQVDESWNKELQALEGHSDPVHSVAFSPDGRLLASGASDKTVRLWDTATGALEQTLEDHSDPVLSVAFSHDGRLLASGSLDSTVRLWDTATGALQQTLKGHSSWVQSVAFSSDGRLLASGSCDETVRLWDTATGDLQQTLKSYSGRVWSVAFSPDSRLLASGSHNKTVQLWDTATSDLQQTLEGHSSLVQSVAFSPDGRLLASGSSDKTVRLWDTATGALQQVLEGHSDRVHSVDFSPDGRLLGSGSVNRTVWLWDTATGVLQQTFEGHSRSVNSIAFSPDGQLLASGSGDKTVRLWDTATGALQQALESHSDQVQSMAFSPDGRLLASGSDDKTVRLWDTATGALQQTLEGHSYRVQSIVFSPNGRLLVSGSLNSTVRLWDTATGALQQTLKGHLGSIRSVAFSLNGRLLASGSLDCTMRLWDTATGDLQQTLKSYSGRVCSVAFSPDGGLLASGSLNKTVQLWDTATGALQQTLKGHSGPIQSVAFSSDGRLLASGSCNETVQLWDTATGALQQTLKGHSGPIQSVPFSPAGALQQTFEGHSRSVHSIAFSPDGRLLASGSDNKTMRLWDTATGALQQTWSIQGRVVNLEFSQDGSCLITNLGALNIQSQCDRPTPNSPHVNLEISIEHGQWIKLNGEKVLWLPTESRPTCFAINGSILALGHASGRISFFEFRV